MRPVRKPELPDHAFGLAADVLLMQCLGEYCSLCERPLPAEAWVWDKATATASSTGIVETEIAELPFVQPMVPVQRSSWRHMLLLDHNCYLAQAGRAREAKPGDLLYPDDLPACFQLSRSSPITYSLEDATIIVLDERGGVANQWPDKRVIAQGATEAAQATIEFFELNTRYYAAGSGGSRSEFRIPLADFQSLADRRVDQRTRVWHQAMDLAQLVRTARAQDREQETSALNMLISQARLWIAAAGFWATWATVLGKALDYDSDLLSRLLSPTGRDWSAGPGAHNLLPGTRDDWLP
jgi:hypothetical protein